MHYVFDATLGALTLKQVSSSSYSPNNSIRAQRGSGAIDPSAFNVVKTTPEATLRSGDISGVLGTVDPTTGLLIAAASALDIPFNETVNGGVFDTDEAFVLSKVTSASGATALILPTSLSAEADGDAQIDLRVIFISNDGIVHPVSSDVSQTISGQAYNASFGFGGVSLDGTMIEKIRGVTVNFGIDVQVEHFNGAVHPQEVNIRQRNPTMEIMFDDFDDVHSQGINFAALTSAVAYFRKRTDGGTYESGSVHTSASFGTGISDTQSISASSGSPGTAGMRLLGKALAVSTTASIPAF